jgi:hypothetical protein
MYMGIDHAGAGNLPPALSNASDSGDPWINNFVANQWASPYITNVGTYPPTYNAVGRSTYTLNNGFMSLIWPQQPVSGTITIGGTTVTYANTTNTAPQAAYTIPQAAGLYFPNASGVPPLVTPTGVLPHVTLATNPYNFNNTGVALNNLTMVNGYLSPLATGGYVTPNALSPPYLGAASSVRTIGAGPGTTLTDDRQHPYWRTELLQKAMNLTTARTHQFAVWITVGFFEVKRQGDVGMLGQGVPQLAFDIFGAELGALNGTAVRYRGFFLVDRTKLTGFDPTDTGAWHSAVVYRKVIQ